jgi:tetratricopeptide (TPR) repeat protein
MRKNLRWIVFVYMISLVSAFSLLAAEEDTVELVKKIKPSVVTVLVYNEKDEMISQGSGFFIADDRIVTNYHVIASAHHAQIKTDSGDSFPVQGLLAEDALKDIVILAVKVPKTHKHPLKLSKSLPQEGQEIVVIGSPLGLEQTVSSGIVTAVWNETRIGSFIQHSPTPRTPLVDFLADVGNEIRIGSFIQFTVPISFSSRGSAIFDKTGAFIGIISSRNEEKKSYLATPVSFILDLPLGKAQPLSNWSKKKESDEEMQSSLSAFFDDNYEEAIIHSKNVVKLDANNNNAYSLLGTCYKNLGQYESAIEALKQAIRINPDDAESHQDLGYSYAKLGQHEKAIEAYKQAIRIKPDIAETHYNLGNAYEKLGQYEKSIEECKQAIRIKPDFKEAHFNLGVAYAKLGQHEKAIEAYKQAIRINPDDAKAHFYLGLGYLTGSRKGDALDEYKILKNLDPELANKLFDRIYP